MVTVMTMCGCLMVGCKGKSTNTTTEATDPTATVTESAVTEEPQEKTFKVTFYDSDFTTVLSTQDVKEGECAKEYTPEKDGAMFTDWYAVKTLTIEYDFSKPVTKDIEIYAGFIPEKEDTRTFALVGSGKSPLLMKSSWGTYIDDDYYMTKADGENVYTITADIMQGDQFQFAINTSWHDQRGAGYMKEKSIDGVEYFSGDGNRSNITCNVSGNYTFTLTTYPGADLYETEDPNYEESKKENFNINPYDTITFTYNGEAQSEGAASLTTSYFIKGNKITGWKDLYDDQYKFTEADGIHTLTIDLEKDDEFMFTTQLSDGTKTTVGTEYVRFTNITDDASKQFVSGTDSANLIALESGTYTFVYNPATTELTVTFQAK